MDQRIVVCDDKGVPTGEYVAKEIGHTGDGKHHLAITVLLVNAQGQVLLQKRKHQRFDGLWDLTGATDLYHLADGRDEGFEQATLRCIKTEYDIDNINNLKNLGGFNYFARDIEQKRREATHFARWNGMCENEYCVMMVGEYDGEIKMDPSVGYEYKWLSKAEFLKDIESNPQNYTPWAIEGVKLLKLSGFFG